MIKQAMIFAAGMGKRMLPITETTPKPLVKINQDSLLVNNIKKLIKSNFNSIIINTFHFPEKIIAEVKDYKNHVKVVIEEERLETGGGLLNCLKKKNLSWESPILLLNSDVYCFNNAFLGSCIIFINIVSSSSSRVAITGNLPINSGIIPNFNKS